jgi:hypothetical protein
METKKALKRRCRDLEYAVRCAVAELAMENQFGPYAEGGALRRPSTTVDVERYLRGAVER